jgi:hypothetical protein
MDRQTNGQTDRQARYIEKRKRVGEGDKVSLFMYYSVYLFALQIDRLTYIHMDKQTDR